MHFTKDQIQINAVILNKFPRNKHCILLYEFLINLLWITPIQKLQKIVPNTIYLFITESHE